MATKILTIKAENFLNWYFNSGYDEEQEDLRTDLGERVIEALINTGQSNISVDDIFNECEKECIPLNILEEYPDEDEDDLEVGDLEEDVEIKLIP